MNCESLFRGGHLCKNVHLKLKVHDDTDIDGGSEWGKPGHLYIRVEVSPLHTHGNC